MRNLTFKSIVLIATVLMSYPLLGQITFGFESNTTASTVDDWGSASDTILQTKGGETLVVTSADTGVFLIDEIDAWAFDAFAEASGQVTYPDAGEYMASYTISLQSGNSFDLNSIFIGDFAGETDNITFTTSKGTVSKTVPAYVDENTAVTFNLSAETNLQGITSVVISADDGTFGVTIDNITLTPASTTSPTVSTSAASSVATTSATLGGNVTDDGGATVSERGVVYSSTDATPEIGEAGVTKETNGSGTGSFSESIGSLSPGTTYYFQAYATNSEGTSYGGVENFTTQKLSQTITFGSLPGKTYGNTDFAPGATASSGLTVSYSSSDAGVATIISNQIHIVGAGTCTIYADQAGNSTYDAAPQESQTLTVGKAALTATADDKSKTYGEVNPSFTVSYNGFVGSDDESDIDTEPSGACTATQTSSTGDYDITVSGGSDDNYSFSYESGTLTINKTTLTATADDTTKVYGEVNPVFTISYSGFVGSDDESDINTEPAGATVATQTSNVGEYDITVSGGTDNNYDFSYTSGTLTVNKATLTATADDKVKLQGEENPSFTISYTGFVGSDDESVLDTPPTAVTSATQASDTGDYAITVSGGNDNNYDFSYVEGVLTINLEKTMLTVTADDKAKIYGEENPELTISYSGFVGADDESTLDTPPIAVTSVTQASDAGEYDITVSGGSDNNYDFMYVTGTLTVNKATLTYTADNKERMQGESDPEFTYQVTGFVNGDNEDDIDVLPTITCEANQNSVSGDYSITISEGSDNNYTFNYISGTLTIQESVALTNTDNNHYYIYPNPTKGNLLVSENLINKEFKIYSISGVLIMTGTIDDNELDITSLEKGVYLMITDDTKFRIVKINP